MTESGSTEYSTPETPAAPKGALFTIFLIVFTDFLGFGIIIPLLPFYVPDYQDSATSAAAAMKVTALFSIFSVCQFIGAPILGAISDRYGRKPVLGISQMGSALGYLLLAVATHFREVNPGLVLVLVYVSRVIDGFTGGNVSTAQAYISDVTTAKDRAKGMGMLGAAFGIGFSAGPFIGGVLGHYNPAWPAYVAAAFAATAGVMSFVRLPETRNHKPAEAEAWLHPRVFAPVLKRPVVAPLMTIAFMTMAAFVMMESTIGVFLNAKFGWGPRGLGYFFGFVGVVIVIIQGGLIGRLTRRFGEWPLAITGMVLVAVGMVLYAGVAFWPLVVLLGVAGAVNAIGRSFQQPTLSALLSHHTDPKEQGVMFGLYHGVNSIARVVGPVIAGFAYPYLHNTGHFVTAGVIVLAAAAWMVVVRAKAGAVRAG